MAVFLSWLSIILGGLTLLPVLGQSATDIFERAISAHGGRTALQQNRSIVWRAPVELGALKGTS